MSSELKIVVTTFADRAVAEKTAHLLVDAGLSVCAQVGADLVSYFRWDGAVRREQEVAVLIKVLPDRYELCAGELKLLHPYDVPQIVAWPAGRVDAAYLAWARGKAGDR